MSMYHPVSEKVDFSKLKKLSREEVKKLQIGDILYVGSYGSQKHIYKYTIKALTNGRAVSGISLRDVKKVDNDVYI
jgi:hypothetical protein